MGMIVKTSYNVRDGHRASFLADFSVIATATRAAPAWSGFTLWKTRKKIGLKLCLAGSLRPV